MILSFRIIYFQSMDKNSEKSDYSERGKSIESSISKMTTFTSMRSTRRQYLSLKKDRSINSNTVYTSTSPVKHKRLKIQHSSLSPDRKSLYWQNWLLPQGVRKQVAFNKPTISAQSVCAILSDTNQVFFSENSHQPRQIASLTKIMTAFTVINICNTFGLKVRDIPILIQKQASMMEGTSANLRSGDQLFVIDLLYGLLLPSGNDAGIALAQYFGKFLSYTFAHENQQAEKQGDEALQNFQQQADFYDAQYQSQSLKLFVFEMNKNCHKIGLKKTQFSNPTGLTDCKNYSTAHQMAILTSFCMKNHLLRTIFKKKVYICEAKNEKLAATRQIEWRNTNTNLFKLKDCIGVKTGITPGAGPCLSSAFRIMGRELVVIILKAKTMQDRFIDSQKIYRHARTKLNKNC